MRKLKAITIKGLFGRHNYELNFDEKGGFTMLAAPNGYGKSTILKIIRAIASGNVFFFWNLDFKTIIVDFLEIDDLNETREECFWIVKSSADAEILNDRDFRFESMFDDYVNSLNPPAPKESSSYWKLVEKKVNPLQDEFNQFYGKFSNYTKNRLVVKFVGTSALEEKLIDKDIWELQKKLAEITDNSKISQVSLSDLFYKNSPECMEEFKKTFPWVQQIQKDVAVNHIYIGANREISGTYVTSDSTFSAEQISKLIAYDGKMLKEYNSEYSRNLDEKLVSHILEEISNSKKSPEELRKSIAQRLQTINEYKTKNGLFGIFNDKERKTTDIDSKKISETTDRTALIVVNTVLRFNWLKLGFFNVFTDRLELFRDTLNRMLSYTTVTPTIEGFTIHSEDPNSGETRELPLDALSSGEQQLIVLLGIILFVEPNDDFSEKTLILLDEPEISMHPAWQEDFSEFLWEVKRMSPIDFIIATHSPTFIGRRWNNVFELAELADGNKSEE